MENFTDFDNGGLERLLAITEATPETVNVVSAEVGEKAMELILEGKTKEEALEEATILARAAQMENDRFVDAPGLDIW